MHARVRLGVVASFKGEVGGLARRGWRVTCEPLQMVIPCCVCRVGGEDEQTKQVRCGAQRGEHCRAGGSFPNAECADVGKRAALEESVEDECLSFQKLLPHMSWGRRPERLCTFRRTARWLQAEPCLTDSGIILITSRRRGQPVLMHHNQWIRVSVQACSGRTWTKINAGATRTTPNVGAAKAHTKLLLCILLAQLLGDRQEDGVIWSLYGTEKSHCPSGSSTEKIRGVVERAKVLHAGFTPAGTGPSLAHETPIFSATTDLQRERGLHTPGSLKKPMFDAREFNKGETWGE